MPRSLGRGESRRRILESAKTIFFEEGFEAANLDDVARSAGVAKGTIYRHFQSKAQLYVEVLVQNADVFVERMRKTLDSALAPDEQLRRLGMFYFHHYSENPEYFRIFWALDNQRMIGELPEQLVRAVFGLWRRCLELLSNTIQRGVDEGVFRPCDAWEMANILWSMANGVLQTETAAEGRALRGVPLERVFESALEVLIRGLYSDSPSPTDETAG